MTRKKVTKRKVTKILKKAATKRLLKNVAKKTLHIHPNKSRTFEDKSTIIPVDVVNTEKFERPKFIANRSLRDLEEDRMASLEVEIDDLLEDMEELNKDEDDLLFKLSENKNKQTLLRDQLLAIKAYRRLRKAPAVAFEATVQDTTRSGRG